MENGVTSPFEDENGTYVVLVNDEGQHSLWPGFLQVPSGWSAISKPDNRAACLEFILKNWTDMRPKSLIESMKGTCAADGLDAAVERPLARTDRRGQ